MSPRPARVVVLCEDRQQATFARRFLMRRGWGRHDIREEIHARGKGAAEQGVRLRFPDELRACRSRNTHTRTGLIAVLDADTREVDDRVRELEDACRQKGVPPRKAEDCVMCAIPRRNIETWLAFLRGEPVNETDEYRKYEFESDCAKDVETLDAMCRQGQLGNNAPPSLLRCCEEFEQFQRLMG